MPIKIEKAVKSGEDRAAGHVWTKEPDPVWLRYEVDLGNGAMRGFHVSKCEGSIPRVTPFRYDFNAPRAARLYHEHVAIAVLANIGRETVVRLGGEAERPGAAGQVEAWRDFKGAFGDTAGVSAPVDPALSRVIVYDGDMGMPSGIVKVGRGGSLDMPAGRGFGVGARLSGFEAVAKIGSKGMPAGLVVGDIGNPAIAQAEKALAHVERPSSHAVAWFGVRDPGMAEIRLQAAASAPILAGLMADRPSLATAIDERRPLQPILMEMTGLGKAAIKRIAKLTRPAPAGRVFEEDERVEGEDALGVNRARRARVSGSVPLETALRHLSELPPDRAPRDDESWGKFNDILGAVAIPLHYATSRPVAEMLDASKGDWVRFHESLARAADFEPGDFDRRTMALTAVDGIEAIGHFTRTVVLPQALASIKEAEQPEPMVSGEFVSSGFDAATALVIGKAANPAVLMMGLSRRYASRIPAMMEIEGRSMLAAAEKIDSRFSRYAGNAFPLLTGEFEAANGLVVTPLPDGDALKQESERLRHCVGSYQSKARRTTCHIYSVRNRSGSESLSTFEFAGVHGENPRSAANGLRLVQHRGRCNAKPPPEGVAACREFVEALRKGLIDINLAEIQDWRLWLRERGLDATVDRATPSTTWKSVLELDWEDDGARLSYWREWGEVLGGRVAGARNPGAIYGERRARDLVSAMSPRAAAILLERERRAGK